MKKIILYCFFSFSVIIMLGQNAPVAVDDTAVISLEETITINVIANDYHPDNKPIWVKEAPGAVSFTDSTITYYAEYYKYYNEMDTVVFTYLIADEVGWPYPECFGSVHLVFNQKHIREYLEVNNIRAAINSWGNNFWHGVSFNYDDDPIMFEYPINSKKNTVFNQNIWVGGINESEGLMIAGERYRQIGYDYWAGPLSVNSGQVSIDMETVVDWHRVWRLNIDDIVYHKYHYTDPGYEPIEEIKYWPAHGDAELHQSEYLAPFIDIDGDSIYDPYKGDYPLIRGDQCIYFIINDVNDHTESGGRSIGLEIHGMAYEFNQPGNEPMHSTVFLSYKIFNRSQNTLNDAYVGLFCDFDIGYSSDDYVGCDVSRGAFFGYNGNEIDGNGESEAYGVNPPAQGIVILGGPLMDANGMDDPGGECDESINGVGFGDGIADNERYGMKKFLYFNNTQGVQGDPETADEYYNYMKAIWRDGTAMEYGGNGHVSSGAYGPAANFMFPGLTDKCYWGTGGEEPYGPVDWTEKSAENQPNDRRGLSVMGPFTFQPESMQKVDIAFVTARGDDGPQSSVDLLMEYIDEVKQEYYEDSDYFGYQWLEVEEENITPQNILYAYPNPASDHLFIDYDAEGRTVIFTIHDLYGRQLVMRQIKPSNTFSVPINDLEKGVYVVSIQDENAIFTTKIMKK